MLNLYWIYYNSFLYLALPSIQIGVTHVNYSAETSLTLLFEYYWTHHVTFCDVSFSWWSSSRNFRFQRAEKILSFYSITFWLTCIFRHLSPSANHSWPMIDERRVHAKLDSALFAPLQCTWWPISMVPADELSGPFCVCSRPRAHKVCSWSPPTGLDLWPPDQLQDLSFMKWKSE